MNYNNLIKYFIDGKFMILHRLSLPMYTMKHQYMSSPLHHVPIKQLVANNRILLIKHSGIGVSFISEAVIS